MLRGRLKELRKKLNMTKAQISDELEVPLSTYSNWEQGTRNPDYYMLVKIADLYNCTLDYLVGRTNKKDEYFAVINAAKKKNIPATVIASYVEFLATSR